MEASEPLSSQHPDQPILPPQELSFGGQRVPVVITLASLKVIMPAVVRIGQAMKLGRFDEAVIDDMESMLIAATGRPFDEVSQWRVTADELQAAIDLIVRAAGIDKVVDDETRRMSGAEPAQQL